MVREVRQPRKLVPARRARLDRSARTRKRLRRRKSLASAVRPTASVLSDPAGSRSLTVAWIRFNLTSMVALGRARWLGALLIAPVLLCAVAASTYSQRCRFTGMVTFDSCCPQSADEANADSPLPEHATLSDPGCCERLVVTVVRAPGATSDRVFEGPVRTVTSLIASPVTIDVLSRTTVGSAHRRSQLPGVAPPAFLLTHSFLI